METIILCRDGRVMWTSGLNGFRDARFWDHVPIDKEQARCTFSECLLEKRPVDWRGKVLHVNRLLDMTGTFHPLPASDGAIAFVGKTLDARVERLTAKELDVCRYMIRMSTKQIAAQMSVSVSTIESHKARIRNKTGLASLELLQWCFRQFG